MVCVSCAWEIMSQAPVTYIGAIGGVRCHCAGCRWIDQARAAAMVGDTKFKVKE